MNHGRKTIRRRTLRGGTPAPYFSYIGNGRKGMPCLTCLAH